jgi:hypothetical protein
LLKQGERVAELLSFVFAEPAHGFREGFDAALAALPHKTDTPEGRLEAEAAAVFGAVAPNQAGAFEASDDAAHSRATNLFGIGKLAE